MKIESGKKHQAKDPGFSASDSQKEYIRFLNDRFGGSVIKNFPSDLPSKYPCSCYPDFKDLFSSDKKIKTIEEKFICAYELTKEKLGKHMPGMTRRTYLKSMTAFLLTSALPFSSSCTLTPSYHDTSDYGIPGLTDEAQVSIVKGDSIEEDVRSAIDLAGGLDEIKEGESVIIKPNCVWHTGEQTFPGTEEPTAPITTNPEVIRAVIRAVKERNNAPDKIFVADRSAIILSTLFVMQMQGIYSVALDEGVNIMPWENTPYLHYTSYKFGYLNKSFDLSETVLNIDHIINVPVLKNHNITYSLDQAQYTCCLKSFVGVLTAPSRTFGENSFHGENLPEHVAEINLCRPYLMKNGRPGVTLNIVDATRIIVDGGPHNSIFGEEMKVAYPQMIIASKDRVACDTAALAVLKYFGGLRNITKDYLETPIWQQRQIVHAGKLGLGINDPGRIEIILQGFDPDLADGIMKIWEEA